MGLRRPRRALASSTLTAVAMLLLLPGTLVLDAQRGRTGGRATTPAPAPARGAAAATRTEAAQLQCPAPLGIGVDTMRSYCDVLTGRVPADGIVVTLPPHTGTVLLTFRLHNRHLYSEELVKTNRAYRKYTATIGALTADNTLLARAVVQNEFRTAADLVERIAGDPGTAAVKAVAPTGDERISISIPAAETTVSILGEKLLVVRPDGTDNFSAPGRPVAVISDVQVEYRPAPVRRPATRR